MNFSSWKQRGSNNASAMIFRPLPSVCTDLVRVATFVTYVVEPTETSGKNTLLVPVCVCRGSYGFRVLNPLDTPGQWRRGLVGVGS